jgi:hypothetical protein
MATISTAINKDYLDAYDGYDQQQVGLGLINPSIYATPQYQKKKIKNLAIGLLSDIRYAGFEYDPSPLILPLFFESPYQTILSLNLNYVPEKYRRAIMKFVLDSNAARIKSNQSMMIDWHGLRRAVPTVQYITRRYKAVGVNVVETHPLNQVPDVIKGQSNWQNHYKTLKGA